jgi:hypothetical protein
MGSAPTERAGLPWASVRLSRHRANRTVLSGGSTRPGGPLKAPRVAADEQGVRSASACCLAVVVSLSAARVVLAATPAQSTPPRQTKQQAEKNLLGATRMLARWRVGLVDPKSGLLRSNTTATCTGRGTAVAGKYRQFICVLRYRTTVVRVLYVVLTGNGFEAHRLSPR